MSSAVRTLSRTVSEPNASSRWNVRPMPRRARRCTGIRVTSRPSSATRPEVGDCSPLITLKHVVLPAPLGPIRPVTVPRSTSNEAWSTAVTPPNWTTTSSTCNNDIALHPLLVHVIEVRPTRFVVVAAIAQREARVSLGEHRVEPVRRPTC